MPLNMKALEEAQAELAKKGGSKAWIQLSKMEKALDIRIQDPVAAMNGLYYQEVPIWWVNNTKIVSPKLLGPGEVDPVKVIIEEAKRAKDPDIMALLNAKDPKGNAKVSFKPEYWIPILKFNWELDSQNDIKGIKDAKSEYNTSLIMKYIEDGKWKFLVCGIMALKAINTIATSRGGSSMTDPVKGFNLIINKVGVGRETKYGAVKDADIMPMPPELYKEDLMIDPFLAAQSMIFTKEYMEAVIGKYLYNDVEIPEKSDDNYAYPELRAELKARFSEEETDAPVQPAARQRPGRGTVNPEPPAELKTAIPVVPQRGSVEGPVRGRAAAAPAKSAGRPAGRPGRNVAEDLKEV